MIFGGGTGDGKVNKTWVLTGADGTTGIPQWVELAAVNPPAPHRGHAAAYDPASNRLIVHGGCLGECTPLDYRVHVLSHSNGLGNTPVWTELATAGDPPPARNSHTAVFDPTSNRLIVFGGDDCCGDRFNDTWVLTEANGLGGEATWIRLAPAGEPPAGRAGHFAAFDAAANRMIVFGGVGESTQYGDLWMLSHANGLGGTPRWERCDSGGTLPNGMSQPVLAYDAGNSRLLVFGARDANGFANDLWQVSRAAGLGGPPAWERLAPTGAEPSPRCCAIAVFREATGRMVLVGNGGTTPIDVWALTLAATDGDEGG